MRSNRLALMGTTLAAVLLGACSQAADMPTAVAMPDVLASASADNNRPVIEGPVPAASGIIPCGSVRVFSFPNSSQRVVRRGLNRHPLGNTPRQNAKLFEEGLLFIATNSGTKVWADVRTELEGTVIEDGETLVFSQVKATRWNGDVVKIGVPNDTTGVLEDANIPATVTESIDWKIKGKKTNYFFQETIVFRYNPVNQAGYEELRSKITTNCR